MCNHKWSPIEGWVGRYRCPSCGTIGYKGTVTAIGHDGKYDSCIFPYICQKTGCRALVVQKRSRHPVTGARKNIQRCREHMVTS